MADSIYIKGTRIWYEDKDHGWSAGEVSGTVVHDKDVTLTLTNERHGKPVSVKTTLREIADNDSKLPPLRNADNFDDINDLTALPHLNEPSSL
jgi:myosin heavy subunit